MKKLLVNSNSPCAHRHIISECQLIIRDWKAEKLTKMLQSILGIFKLILKPLIVQRKVDRF